LAFAISLPPCFNKMMHDTGCMINLLSCILYHASLD
jgi:hypothetical protein